ncbi:MAG: purine-nucleoside phosphorylase [Bacteroidales bacterium]
MINTTYQETVQYITYKWNRKPIAGIILGSGLGDLAKEIEIEVSIPYKDIPNFPVSTVEGHEGKLLLGILKNKPVIAMQGRFHYYEGYTMQQVTFPIRVMKLLGISYLFVSNAAGGLNPYYKVGDIMIIRDHINFFPEHPLRGKNDDSFGVRFPDMSKAYCPLLRNIAKNIAHDLDIQLCEGVYVGNSGPTLETPAEYAMFHKLGGDAVGMSTVPEIIVGHHAGIRCFGVSIITNQASKPESETETTHQEVQKVAQNASKKLGLLLSTMFEQL